MKGSIFINVERFTLETRLTRTRRDCDARFEKVAVHDSQHIEDSLVRIRTATGLAQISDCPRDIFDRDFDRDNTRTTPL